MASIKGKLQSGALQIAWNVVAVAAFVLLIVSSARVVGFVLAAVAAAGIALRARSDVGGTVTAQAFLTAGLVADYARHTDGQALPLSLAGALLALLIIDMPIFAKIIDRDLPVAANLPGYAPASTIAVPEPILYSLSVLWIAVLGVFAAAELPAWPVVVTSAIGLAVAGVCAAQALRARLRGGRTDPRLRAALERHGAAFALYFSAPDDTEYHVEMWRPYLERADLPWMVIAREPRPFAKLSRMLAATAIPVVYCPMIDDIDIAVTPGLGAVFYVNNGMKNTHMVRFHHLTHVQLLHGDSDKASSYNPVTAMFNKIFVAGQAAIDRYAANGVLIPAQKFEIVGRPQVEAIRVSHAPISEVVNKVVLYATTWVSHYDDANYSSLRIGEKIVTALLERGVTVILRPHPYTDRHAASARTVARLQQILAEDRTRTGRPHVFGTAATRPSLFECINHADAMISDVSGVASDFLYSGKPFALTDMLGLGRDGFADAFPLSQAAYQLAADAGNVGEVLDDLLAKDPLTERRREAKAYYLGEFDDYAYADHFLAAVRAATGRH